MWRGDDSYLRTKENPPVKRQDATASTPRRKMTELLDDLDAMAPAGMSAGLHIRFASPLVYVRSYPEAWIKLYDRNAFALRDPLVFWGIASAGHTRWSEISLPDPFGILKQGATFGLKYGAVFSHGQITSRSIVGLARSDREFTDAEIETASTIVAALHVAAEPTTELTKAQIEALRLLSEGDRHTAAAAKLGISESAFKARLQSARTRLGARTTAQALKKAREYQLL